MRHLSLVCVALLLVTLHPAAGLAALTSVSCLVKKVQLSGALRECLATLAVKQLEGKPLPIGNACATILAHRFPCGMALCIDPIFGPTLPLDYWSTTTINAFPDNAWAVSFDSGEVVGPDLGKPSGARVRAVRGGWCGLLVEGASGSFDELNCGIP